MLYKYWILSNNKNIAEDITSSISNYGISSCIDEYEPYIIRTDTILKEKLNCDEKPKILILEDDIEDLTIIHNTLYKQYSCFLCPIQNINEGIEAFKIIRPMCCTIDLSIGGQKKLRNKKGFELLEKIKNIEPDIDPIVLSAYPPESNRVKAIEKWGASFIRKGEKDYKKILKAEIKKSIDFYNVKNKIKLVDEPYSINKTKKRESDENIKKFFPDIIGNSPLIINVMEKAKIYATFYRDKPILITGNSGTGKTLLAQSIHKISKFQDFKRVNVGKLDANLGYSELFGHVKGAYTGANQKTDRQGVFEKYIDGTILLDDIDTLCDKMQEKLLYFFDSDSYQFTKLGDEEGKIYKFKGRVILATNQNLEDCIKKKIFREDLYNRIKGFKLHIPDLDERKEDIAPLAKHIVEKINRKEKKTIKINNFTIRQLMRRSYKGANIRDLEQCIEEAYAHCLYYKDEFIKIEDINNTKEKNVDFDYFSLIYKELEKDLPPLNAFNIYKKIINHDDWKDYINVKCSDGTTPAMYLEDMIMNKKQYSKSDILPKAKEPIFYKGLLLMAFIVFQIEREKDIKSEIEPYFPVERSDNRSSLLRQSEIKLKDWKNIIKE